MIQFRSRSGTSGSFAMVGSPAGAGFGFIRSKIRVIQTTFIANVPFLDGFARGYGGVMYEGYHNNDVIHAAFGNRCSKTCFRALISENQSHQGFPTRSDVSIPVDGLSVTDLSSLGSDFQTCGGPLKASNSDEVVVLPTTTRCPLSYPPGQWR
jgi:hypothetical protein